MQNKGHADAAQDETSGSVRVFGRALSRESLLRWMTFATCVTASVALYLNFYSRLAGGITHRFENQAEIIRNGMDLSLVVDTSTLTYPMWGYGWLFAITQNRLELMGFQMLLGVVATLWFARVLSRDLETSIGLLGFIGLVAVALPWYSLHSTVALYAPASSLLLLSITSLIIAVTRTEKRVVPAIASGLLFGLCLNFRSDYMLMPIGLAVIALYCRPRRHTVKCLGAWLASMSLIMVPWMMHTKRVTGAPRVTSTNGGHAMFVGLGQLSDNIWGITASDRDPQMLEIVETHLGPGASSLGFEADRMLKDEFRRRVAAHPYEYMKKMAYSGLTTMTQGAYPGEFLNTAEHALRREETISRCKTLLRTPAGFVHTFGVEQAFRTLLMILSYGMTRLVILVSFLAAPFVAWRAVRRRALLPLIVIGCIVYQMLLQMCVYNLPWYTSSVLLFHIANLGVASDQVGRHFGLAVER